jgi:hypothetical protein
VNGEKFGDCKHASVHSDIFEDKMNRNSEMKNLLLKITIKVVKMILAIQEK